MRLRSETANLLKVLLAQTEPLSARAIGEIMGYSLVNAKKRIAGLMAKGFVTAETQPVPDIPTCPYTRVYRISSDGRAALASYLLPTVKVSRSWAPMANRPIINSVFALGMETK